MNFQKPAYHLKMPCRIRSGKRYYNGMYSDFISAGGGSSWMVRLLGHIQAVKIGLKGLFSRQLGCLDALGG